MITKCIVTLAVILNNFSPSVTQELKDYANLDACEKYAVCTAVSGTF